LPKFESVHPDGNMDIVAILLVVLVPDSVVVTGAVAVAFCYIPTVGLCVRSNHRVNFSVFKGITRELEAMSLVVDGVDIFVTTPGSAFNGSADFQISPVSALGLLGTFAIMNSDTMSLSGSSEVINSFSFTVSIIAYSLVFGVDGVELDIFGDIHICGTRAWSLANVSNSGPELAICVFSLVWAWAMLPVESAMIIR